MSVGLSRARRIILFLIATCLLAVGVLTPSTSTIPGKEIWAVLGLASASFFFAYVFHPTADVMKWAFGTFIIQAVPRALVWVEEGRYAAAAIWFGWLFTMTLMWIDRERFSET